MAPLVVKNHIIAGVSGDVTDIPVSRSIDPETGAEQWKWFTAPKTREPAPKLGRKIPTPSLTAAA